MQKCRHPILTLSCAIFLLAILLFCVKPVWEKVEPTDTAPKGTKGLAYHALSDGTYSVSIGSATKAKKIVIPEVYNGKAVTAIADQGFGGASKLEKITIPDSVIEIGDFAFNNCSKLSTVKLPPHLVCIGEQAFGGCKALSELTVPDSVLNLGEAAFFGCTKLERVTLGDGIAQIGTDVFFGCTKLASVALPENLTEIGERAFFGCKALAELTVPDSVTEIGEAAFSGCAKLERLVLGDGVTVIGAYAFSGCSSLTVSTLPNALVEIGEFAFSGCAGFELTEHEGVFYVGSEENPHLVAVGLANRLSAPTVLSLHQSTRIVLYRAFEAIESLIEVDLPDGLVSIGSHAFYRCENLASLVLPATLKMIGQDGFRRDPYYNCPNTVLYFEGTATIEHDLFYVTIYYNSPTHPNTAADYYWTYVDGEPTLVAIPKPDPPVWEDGSKG